MKVTLSEEEQNVEGSLVGPFRLLVFGTHRNGFFL